MGTKIVDPVAADPKTQSFEAQKAKFEAAVAKTKTQAGEPAPTKEEPASEPAPVEAKPARLKQPKKPKVDPLAEELAALKAQVFQLSQKKAEPEEDTVEDEVAARARERLAARFGEDEAQDLVEIINEMREGDRSKIARMESAWQHAMQTGRANLSRSNQRRLSKDHPQLKNEAAWKIVHDQALLAYEKNSQAFEGFEDAYDQTVAALYGEPEEDEEGEDEEASEDVEKMASRVAASQLTVPTKSPRRESRSKEERAREHFEYLKKNPEDKAGSNRLAKELGLR